MSSDTPAIVSPDPAPTPDPAPEPAPTPAAPDPTPAPAIVATPEPQPNLPGTATWLESLPADLRGDPSLRTVPDVPTLAKNYIEAQSQIGRKGVILPKDGDAADRKRFHREMGVPDTSDGYDFSNFTAPENLPIDETMIDRMKPVFHEIGVTPDQALGLANAFLTMQGEDYGKAVEQIEQNTEAARQSLRNEYGASYEASMDLAKRAFAALAGDSANEVASLQMIDGTKLGDNAAFFRIFAKAGKSLSEHELMGQGTPTVQMTPEAAEAERSKLRADPEFQKAWLAPDHPDHKQAVARMARLTGYATPNQEREVVEIE